MLLLLLACAKPVPPTGPLVVDHEGSVWETIEADAAKRPRRTERSRGEQVARAAASFVGESGLRVDGTAYRWDCSGLVNAAYAAAGFDLGLRNTEGLFELARETGVHSRRREPFPGDVVFFDDTYDRNENGRLDDPLSHVAIVERVDDDGTITLVHKGGKGVARLVMNLHHPDERTSPEGKEWNSHLRARTRKDREGTRYLTGELWRGTGSFWQLSPGAALVDATDEVGSPG